jgi:hypothetical protein
MFPVLITLCQEIFWCQSLCSAIAWCVPNDSTIGNEENKIAQGMISMMPQPALKVQVSILAPLQQILAEPPHEVLSIGKYLFVKRPRFLFFHWTVHFYLMSQQINNIVENEWQVSHTSRNRFSESRKKAAQSPSGKLLQPYLILKGCNATRKKVSNAIADHCLRYWQRRSLDKNSNIFEK